jgi:hypothetical protein
MINNSKPIIDKSEPNVDDLKPNINKFKLIIDKPEPNLDSPKPEINNSKPDINNSKPEIDKPKPVVKMSEPDIKKSKPVTERPKSFRDNFAEIVSPYWASYARETIAAKLEDKKKYEQNLQELFEKGEWVYGKPSISKLLARKTSASAPSTSKPSA